MRTIIFSLLLMGPLLSVAVNNTSYPLRKANIDLKDKASLQRGAKWVMNYCTGCHSLQYQRYSRMAKDIGIVDENGEVDKALVQSHLIFTGEKIGDTIKTAMSIDDARQWFGIEPPDLTLIARVRGADWLYTYLTGFYRDENRIWGSNNVLIPEVGMPNVLEGLQGVRIPVYRSDKPKVLDHIQLIEEGEMNQHEFDSMAKDIVNFLSYVAEPIQLERKRLGIWVLLFLFVLALLAYLLKKEYWKDV